MAQLKFKFKITLIPGIRITTFRINSQRLDSEAIDAFQSATNPNLYEGEVIVICIEDTVEVSISGVGNPFLAGSFNITQNGKNLFSTDQDLIVREGGRIRFYKPNVKLPK